MRCFVICVLIQIAYLYLCSLNNAIKMLSYLNFWWKSSNQHGVHSPFVYNYLTKGLYEVKNPTKNKRTNWILKSIFYFKPQKIYIQPVGFLKQIKVENELLTNEIEKAELLFFSDFNSINLKDFISQIHSDQLLFICLEKYDVTLLNSIRNNKEVTLVLDFYLGCIISKRKKQLKQNFFLRL